MKAEQSNKSQVNRTSATQTGEQVGQQHSKSTYLQDNRPQTGQMLQMKQMMDSYVPKNVLQQKQNDTGLPDNLKSGIENLSGYSMDDVKVHYNSDKPAQLNAHAYAQGTDIHLASGQEKHLPHEAWHVVQQKQGRVQPTLQMKGKVNVNDEEHLEKEADEMGDIALKTSDIVAEPAQLKKTGISSVAQRSELEEEATDPTNDLRELVTQLNSLKEQEQDPTASERLSGAIEQINEVISSDDKELQVSILGALHEELKDSLIESVMNNEEDGTSDTEQEVIQGQWEQLGALLSLYPKTSIGIGVTAVVIIIERVIAYNKKKTLPPKLTNTLFDDDILEYWNLVQRKIRTFCQQHNFDNHDQNAITQATRTAIQNSTDDGDFLGLQLPTELTNLVNSGTLHHAGAQAILVGAGPNNLYNSLGSDIQATTSKTINTTTVPQNQKAAFAAALKQIPFVQNLYDGTVQKSLGKNDGKIKRKMNKRKWKNDGSIASNIVTVNDGNTLTTARDQIDNGAFQKKVQDAERIVKQMVEPSILSQVPRPVINVHTQNRKKISRPWGFRAYQLDGQIHLAQDHETSTIVHEIGHHIEDYLPMLNYQDIKLLLEGRNLDAKKAGYIYPHSYDEQRYVGDYPATGKYTSKLYDDGATEVMSMSAEYLAHPTKFKELIEKDPQQAAIILRLLHPAQYATTGALVPFNIYLPQ